MLQSRSPEEGTDCPRTIGCRGFQLILMFSSNSNNNAGPQPLVNNVAEISYIIFYNPESITPSPLFYTVQVVNFHYAIILF